MIAYQYHRCQDMDRNLDRDLERAIKLSLNQPDPGNNKETPWRANSLKTKLVFSQ